MEMPVYEYECEECKKVFEELRRMSDAEPAPCPACGSIKTKRRISLFSGGKAAGGCSHDHAGGGG